MRLKEIKPGMVIRCRNEEEKKALLEEAERLGYHWIYSNKKPTDNIISGNSIHFYADKSITWSDRKEGTTKFSDLIIQELSAYELLKIMGEIKIHCMEDRLMCGDCRLNRNNNKSGVDLCDFKNLVGNEEVLLEICKHWKTDKEKKEPEIETVDICRIIEVLQDKKRVVHEETLTGTYGSTKEEESQEILKQYISEHEGNYIAVVEHVFKAKAVE